MKFFRLAFLAIVLPFVLTACQTSQSATSSYGGSALGKKPVKSAKAASGERRVIKSYTAAIRFEEPAYNLSRRYSPPRKRSAVATPHTARPDEADIAPSLRKPTKSSKAKRLTPKTIKVFAKRNKVVKRSRKKVRKARRVAKSSSRRTRYNSLIRKYARANGVPVRLAMAVVQVESNHNARARGRAGEIGLMQIMPRTARGIGYRGKMSNLYNPATNLRYGMKYLGKAYRLGGRSTCGAILKYNAGHGAKRMNPISRKYCQRVQRILRSS